MPTREEILDQCQRDGLLISKNEIELEHLLGQGSFGATYTALYKGERVAVKQVSVKAGTPGLRLFLREMTSLQNAKSPHVVKLHGVVMEPEPQGPTWLVLEFCAGGTLRTWLYGDHHHWRSPKHSFAEKLGMCLQIAQGMQDLESLQPPVMHRDLKLTNILLNGHHQPVISDLGLSRTFIISEQGTLTGETGSYVYMSPEMTKSEPYGPKTDVYSFAIIMAEIITVKEPFHDFKLMPAQVATFVADKDGRPNLPAVSSHFPQELKELIVQCWDRNPDARPTFASIATALQSISCK